MKKKLLTTVLTVGMVLSLVGCGAKETTSSESVAETTEVTTEYGTEETTVEEVVEETTVAETEVVEETVAEETVKEKIPVDITDGVAFMNQVITNHEAQKYIVIENNNTSIDVNDPTVRNTVVTEYLYDWNSDTACILTQAGDIMYHDYANNASYTENDDKTGFYKFNTDEYSGVKDAVDGKYGELKYYVGLGGNFVVTELAEGNYAGYYCATVQFDFDNSYIYTLDCYVDPYTLLPVNYTVTMCDKNKELILEDGTTVTGEYFVVMEDIFNLQYLAEGSEDFATFQSAIQLPAEDEYTSVSLEGETTTTE